MQGSCDDVTVNDLHTLGLKLSEATSCACCQSYWPPILLSQHPVCRGHTSASDNDDDNDDDDDSDSEGDGEELPFLFTLELVLCHRLGVENDAAAFLGMDEELCNGRADEWTCVVGRAVCEGLKTQTQTHDGGTVEGVGEDKNRSCESGSRPELKVKGAGLVREIRVWMRYTGTPVACLFYGLLRIH